MSLPQKMWFLIASLLISPAVLASSNSPVIVGNGVFKQASLETVIRGLLADALQANISKNKLSFEMKPIRQKVTLPVPTGSLKSMLDELGIKENLGLGISPIHADFILPNSDFSLVIQNTSERSFLIKAKWSLSSLAAQANALSIDVPPGLFDQAFQIVSSPVVIALKSESHPVEFQVTLTADLEGDGARIKVQSVKTNLETKNHPEFSAQIGKLTVNQKPLELEVQTNGRTLVATEPSIRSELQKLDSVYTDLIRKSLSEMIQTQIMAQMKTLEKKPPFRYDLNSNAIISNIKNLDPDVQNLLSNMELALIPSHIASIQSEHAYSLQLSSSVCMDNQCVENLTVPNHLNPGDFQKITDADDTSLLLYETFFQSIIQSDAFEKRIATYYRKMSKLPGVALSPAGVKIYFEPSMNAFVLILNLEIQIDHTTLSTDPLPERIERTMGTLIEDEFGSGPVVKIPIPIALKLNGLSEDQNGVTALSISTDLSSLHDDGSFVPYSRCSPQDCPNNVSEMTKFVRDNFIPIVKKDILNLLSPQISVPLGKNVSFKNLAFQVTEIAITPDHKLLLTAKTSQLSEEAKP